MNDQARVPDTLPASLRAHDGLALHLHHWPVAEPKGVIQLIHGMCEHLGRFGELAGVLNQAGWAVAGVDHRGHGRSEGARGVIVQADDYLMDQAVLHDALSQTYRRKPHVMLGYSMGGVIAGRFGAVMARPLASAPWARPIDGLIMAAPALEPTLSAPQRATLSVLARLVPDLALPVANRIDWTSAEPRVLDDIRADPLIHYTLTSRVSQFMLASGRTVYERAPGWTLPTLLLYGRHDRLIPARSCERFASLVPRELIETHVYEDMEHSLFHEASRGQVHAHVTAWLARVS
jgi:alpha-beta hydrolase superfamily lysophospholipase